MAQETLIKNPDLEEPTELSLGPSITLTLQPRRLELEPLVAAERRSQAASVATLNDSNIQMDYVDWWTGQKKHIWQPAEKAIRDQQLARLEGQAVVDLGCGPNAAIFEQFLTTYGPAAYVGIDGHNHFEDRTHYKVPDFGEVAPLSQAQEDSLPGVLIKGGMLETLSRLPDGSVNVALNGIDTDVTGSPYTEELVREIARITRPDGLVFGITLAGGVLQTLAEQQGFKVYKTPVNRMGPNDKKNFYFLAKESLQLAA